MKIQFDLPFFPKHPGRWLVGALLVALISNFLSLVWVQRSLESEPVKYQRDVTTTEAVVEVKSYRARPGAKTLDCLENGPQAQFSCTRSGSQAEVRDSSRPEWLWPQNVMIAHAHMYVEEICRIGGDFTPHDEADL